MEQLGDVARQAGEVEPEVGDLDVLVGQPDVERAVRRADGDEASDLDVAGGDETVLASARSDPSGFLRGLDRASISVPFGQHRFAAPLSVLWS